MFECEYGRCRNEATHEVMVINWPHPFVYCEKHATKVSQQLTTANIYNAVRSSNIILNNRVTA